MADITYSSAVLMLPNLQNIFLFQYVAVKDWSWMLEFILLHQNNVLFFYNFLSENQLSGGMCQSFVPRTFQQVIINIDRHMMEVNFCFSQSSVIFPKMSKGLHYVISHPKCHSLTGVSAPPLILLCEFVCKIIVPNRLVTFRFLNVCHFHVK